MPIAGVLAAPAGALLSAGERLTPDTIARVGAALAAVTAAAGDDEGVRGAAAAATGAYAVHCSPEQLRAALEAGPLSPGSGRLAERVGSAATAAAVARHAAARLAELDLLQRFVGERLGGALEGRGALAHGSWRQPRRQPVPASGCAAAWLLPKRPPPAHCLGATACLQTRL
jgi:hypothetical protein